MFVFSRSEGHCWMIFLLLLVALTCGERITGLINVNQTRGHHLFFWAETSQGDPNTDPVVLWMNGGAVNASF